MFELTPEGIKKEQDVDRSDSITHQTGRKLDRAIIVILVVALAWFAWDKWVSIPQEPASDTSHSPSAGATSDSEQAMASSVESAVENSIAVLPFENFSGDESDSYFADGLADTLLHKLAQIGDLKVIARNSSFQFKGSNRDIREIGEILGVTTVLEGSVQRAGDQVRVIAQLINASDGVHIWSQSFDDTMENIFALQDRIAEEIVQNLQVNLTEDELTRILRSGTDSPAAYDFLMLARSASADITLDDLAETDAESYLPITLLNRALEIDPDYAQAWVYLSDAYNGLAFQASSREDKVNYTNKAGEYAQKALELDPLLAEAHTALGFFYWRNRNISEAIPSFRKSLELNPNEVGAMAGLGLALVQTNPEEAYRLFVKSVELDPRNFLGYRQQSFALQSMGRIDESVKILEEAAGLFPEQSVFNSDLALVYGFYYGRFDEAASWISHSLKSSGMSLNGGLEMTAFWRQIIDIGRATAWLERVELQFGVSDDSILAGSKIHMSQGDHESVSRDLQQLLERQVGDVPSNPELLRIQGFHCLGLAEFDCALEAGLSIRQIYERGKKMGGNFPIYRRLATLLEGAAYSGLGNTEKAEATLQPLIEELTEVEFVNMKFGDGGKRYMLADSLSILGRTGEAIKELENSLSLPDGGILALTSSLQPPESNVLFANLRGNPKFEDWLSRFHARRDAIYQSMLELEASGKIISVAAVKSKDAHSL